MSELTLHLDPTKTEDYRTFLKVKRLPKYTVTGRTVRFPQEYAERMGVGVGEAVSTDYAPIEGLFDYQRDIVKMAAGKGKFSIFADCGLGKTLMELEFARHAADNIGPDQCVLIVTPLMVVSQMIGEARQFYGDSLAVERVTSATLADFLTNGTGKIGIVNWDALTEDTPQGRLGGLILDESSMLKGQYAKRGGEAIRLGKGLRWKLAATGTPAPNDRIEYANHAVFMDAYPTQNAFLSRFFVNRGQTDNRWELKPHAIGPFYTALSHWSIFLTNPATYGWKDNCESIPPMHVHIHDVPLTQEQTDLAYETTGTLLADRIGGIASRSVLSQVAKGHYKGRDIATNKTSCIESLVNSWPDESTIIWCLYNAEQKAIAEAFPDAANIDGSTPLEVREELIAEFKAGTRKILISKPKVLGFGLNLQVATRHVFSGLQDSYESYYQAVKRSNRYGSTKPLNVHIPVTDIERPMIETVMSKADRVDADTREQERIFKNAIK